MSSIKNQNGRKILLNMVHAIQENKQYLGDVDGLIGDGDHGMNMNKGFSIYEKQLGENETSLSDGLFDLGSVLMNKIGGSMGPIYGTIFMEMSDIAQDTEEITLPLFKDMTEAALKGLYEIIDARPGDKTLVDTLYPAIQSLKASVESDKDFVHALEDMIAAAENGKDSTKDMVAKYGRSARLGERSRGVLDAGATSCCIILKAIAEGMIQQMKN